MSTYVRMNECTSKHGPSCYAETILNFPSKSAMSAHNLKDH